MRTGVLQGLVQLDKIEASKSEYPVHWLHVMYKMSILTFSCALAEFPVHWLHVRYKMSILLSVNIAVQVTELTH